ncbi:MAG: hypothetical protein ACJ8HQ_04090 [Chthoniobacterales bacterium]
MNGGLSQTAARFEQVVICSGHMIDAPDRKEPRFPATKAEAVREQIGHQLDQWKINGNALAICGGASGADTLFGEEALKRGARLRLLLAQNLEAFVRDSVEPAGEEWVRRFRALASNAQVDTLTPAASKDEQERSIYERTNLWIIETARRAAGEGASLYALLVWDEKPTGDGPGGTSDFERRVCDLGGEVAIINPTAIP